YFINILSSGLMTEVSQNTPTAMKNIFGRVAYYFSVMGELPSFKKINITMSEPSGAVRFSGQCLLYMVLNGRTAGNLPMAVDASADDGLLEVLIFKGENIAATIGDLFHILVKQSSDYPDDVVYFQSSRLKVTIKGLATTDIDGDKGSHYPLDIECLKGELQIIC
ncbi:MAG: lipid kinase, partial [Mucinivorans sp.]